MEPSGAVALNVNPGGPHDPEVLGDRPLRAAEDARRCVPELLAPAGTMDAFKAALAAGADAIYCGMGAFNARRNAENLTMESFTDACAMAHVAGSRVYVTTNILVREDELPRALALVHDCAAAGADAFIFQDWGLLALVRELWPRIECHLSTQANVHDPNGVRFAVRQGCSRVTLSRELSLPEIASCSGLGAELEVFGHGALCVCYSGECLLSSMQRGKSANRGLCRQPCRLPYRMLDDRGREVSGVGGTRLLSPRDCCTIADLPDLVRAGMGALKIEGRMKAPDYVGTVVGAYRRALDEVGRGLEPTSDAAVMRALARAFNRDFTDGYLHGVSDNSIMSYERGNNRGQLAGRVHAIRGRLTVLALDEPVGEGDLLEIRNPDRFDDYVTVPSPRDADAPCVLEVALPRAMGVGCPVRVIRSERGMAEAREFASRAWPRKRPVDVRVTARVGRPFTVELATRADDAHPDSLARSARVVHEGFVVERARTRAVTAQEIAEHVCRFGTSPFVEADVRVDVDEGVGMPFSAVHAARAEAVAELIDEIGRAWREAASGLIDAPFSVHARPAFPPASEKPVVCALVSCGEAAREARRAGAGLVYAYVEDIVGGQCSSGRRGLGSESLEPADTIPVFGEVSRAAEFERFGRVLENCEHPVLGTAGWLEHGLRVGASDPWLWNTVPLHNHAAFEVMRREGVRGAWLSPELELLEIRQLAKTCGMRLGATVLGHIRTMTTEHCLLQSMGDCARACPTCPRRTAGATVRDEFDRPSIVTSDAFGRSRLWQHDLLDVTPQIPELLESGVTRFMVDCSLFEPAEAARMVRRASEALACALDGRVPAPRLRGATSGHLFERIG